jgi:hypothetical protein
MNTTSQMNTSALSMAHGTLVLDIAQGHPLHSSTLIGDLKDGSSVPLREKVVWSVFGLPPNSSVACSHASRKSTLHDVGQHIERWLDLVPECSVDPIQVRAVLLGVFGGGEFQTASGVGGGVQTASGSDVVELAIIKQQLCILKDKIECVQEGLNKDSLRACAKTVNEGFRSIKK